MIDWTPWRDGDITFAEFQARFTQDDLRRETNAMVDHMLALIADCTDADVVFVPVDEEADDPYAEDEADTNLAWTLGHVVVHTTASAEEAAFLAAELARGVENKGRSRYEIPWETVTTIAQCRERLEESRRMRLASLDMWPSPPHLETTYESKRLGSVDPIGRFLLGLGHDTSHVDQIAEIVRQARAARQAA